MKDNIYFKKNKKERLYATTYGRTALLLALQAIDVQGKEVLIPAFTCPITVVATIVQAGGIPVFVDIDLDTLNFHTHDLAAKLSERTKVIISHHYFGLLNKEIAQNHRFAQEHHLVHIEDCCHIFGFDLTKTKSAASEAPLRIYSCSKDLLTPAGGILIDAQGKYDARIQNIQSRSKRSVFDQLLNNLEILHYWYHLKLIRRRIERIPKKEIQSLLQVRQRMIYAFLFLFKALLAKTYYSGDFYNIQEQTPRKQYPFFDTRMNALQRLSMQARINHFTKNQNRQATIFKRLLRHIGFSPYQAPETMCTHNSMLLWIKDKTAFLKAAAEKGIHFHETWPAEGRMWSSQLTKNIQFIQHHMLWIHISLYWQEAEIQQLEAFLKEQQHLFYTSINEMIQN